MMPAMITAGRRDTGSQLLRRRCGFARRRWRRRAARRRAGELSRHRHPVPFHVHALYVGVVIAPLLLGPGAARGARGGAARALPALAGRRR